MAFFKFRQRGQPATEPAGRASAREPAAGPQETIDSVRRRARHRLVGAAVLVLLAIVGFPLLFDTQPRPVAVNAPITIPDKDRAAPLRMPDALPADASLDDREEVVARADKPSARAPAAVVPPVVPAAPARSALTDKPAAPARETRPDAEPSAKAKADEAARAKADEAARAKADDAARMKAEQAAARAQREQDAKAQRDDERAKAAAEARRASEQSAAASAKKPEDDARARREAEQQRAKREEAARARALLEGRNGSADKAAAAATADKPGRFIVQVGAFADDTAAREARQKAERTGVKTYTQVVDTKDGKRTRVRVGPFASREEADKAAAALKKAGLAGAVLSL